MGVHEGVIIALRFEHKMDMNSVGAEFMIMTPSVGLVGSKGKRADLNS